MCPRSGGAIGVLVVMVDHRPLFASNASLELAGLTFTMETALLNAEWAYSHGYEFRFAEVPADSVWARLNEEDVSRHVAWARLLVFALISRRYRPRHWLLYFD